MSKPRTVDVTFPVTIRLEVDEAENSHTLKAIRDDLSAAVVDAATGYAGDPARALCARTPDDDGLGTFDVTVGKPTVELDAWLYEEGIARDIRDVFAGPRPGD